MKSIRPWIHSKLPSFGDRLPICGRFYRDVIWTGCGPIPYPAWFLVLCRLECWALIRLYRWTCK